jgi:integrase
MAGAWKSTSYVGVRFREHESRKHGVRPDRYFSIRYRFEGGRREEGLGWTSEGMTAAKAAGYLAKLKEAQRTGAGARTLEEARAKEAERRERLEQEKQLAQREGVTFQAIFEDHYLSIAKQNKKSVTWKTELHLFNNWINPIIGNRPMKDIKPLHLQKIKKSMMDAGRAARTVQYALTVVRQVYNFAILHDLYDGTNPVSKIRMPKVDNKRLRFLSHEEADRLLEALARRSVRLYEMSLISLNCGLRAGEIHALKWADLDLQRGTVSVLDGKGWNRVVPMPRAVIEMLSAKDRTSPDDLIFPSRKGNQKVWVSRTFARVVNELGFNEGISDRRHRVSFHTLRHTYASWLVERGVDLYMVKELLGHSTVQLTERYAHLRPDTLKRAVQVLEEQKEKAGTGKAVNIGTGNQDLT